LVRPYARSYENLIEMGLLVFALFSYQTSIFLSATANSNSTPQEDADRLTRMRVAQTVSVIVKYILVIMIIVSSIADKIKARYKCRRRSDSDPTVQSN
jgi:hypothetical protein